MRALQLYFRLHRPYELKHDGLGAEYFGGEADFREADRTEYQPFFALLERNAQKFPDLRISLGVSGLWLEQAERWDADLVRRLRRLVNLGNIEVLLTPYDYSLSWFYDQAEFVAQIEKMRRKLSQALGTEPTVLAMPELIYHDKIAAWAAEQKLTGVLTGAAEVALDYRSPNQVFKASEHRELSVLCQNTRFSEAIRHATALAMVEGEQTKTEFVATETPVEAVKPQKKATAAEFVRGMAGVKDAMIAPVHRAHRSESTGRMEFSARKFQKELELEVLRGDLINLALDTRIFAEYRELGIVRFFDELITSWLTTKHKIISASQAIEAFPAQAKISIKDTIAWRGKPRADGKSVGLAMLKDVQFCPPRWLSSARQMKATRTLYALKAQVFAAKDQDLYREFQKFTALDYLEAMSEHGPALVGEPKRDGSTAKQNYDTFMAVLERFTKIVEEKQPQPLKITKTASEAKKAAESDFAIKVNVRKPKAGRREVQDAGDWDELITENWFAEACEGEEILEDTEEYEEDFEDEDEAETDEMDDAAAEVQILAQRISRQQEASRQNLDALAEAELIEGE